MNIDSAQFNLPPGFVMPTSHKPSGSREGDGVSTFDYGKQGYVAWRFAYSARPWKESKVKKYRIDGADTVPVILFYRDKDNQVPIKLLRKMRYEERVNRFGEPFDKGIPLTMDDLPKDGSATELDLWTLPLGFDSEVFQVAFERWKQQGSKPGTPISNWRADPGQVNTFAALGIFTVEQLGQMSEEALRKAVSSLPPSASGHLIELHELAIAFVNAQAGRVDASEFGHKLEVLENANERLKEELENKDAEIQKLLEKIKGTSTEKPKNKKPVVVDGRIEGVE